MFWAVSLAAQNAKEESMSEIIYKDTQIVVGYKPAGTPTQPEPSGDVDFMTEISAKLEELKEKSELFLIHRLDRVVGGLLVLARNRDSAARLSALAASAELGKAYLAVVEGECTGGVMEDYLYKNAALGKSVVTDGKKYGAKLARLEYECVETVDAPTGKRSLVRIVLHSGRFHQIRAQFSSRSMPLVGDNKYGSRDKRSRMPALFAHRIDIELNEKIHVSKLPDTSEYPWSLFSEESYKNV